MPVTDFFIYTPVSGSSDLPFSQDADLVYELDGSGRPKTTYEGRDGAYWERSLTLPEHEDPDEGLWERDCALWHATQFAFEAISMTSAADDFHRDVSSECTKMIPPLCPDPLIADSDFEFGVEAFHQVTGDFTTGFESHKVIFETNQTLIPFDLDLIQDQGLTPGKFFPAGCTFGRGPLPSNGRNSITLFAQLRAVPVAFRGPGAATCGKYWFSGERLLWRPFTREEWATFPVVATASVQEGFPMESDLAADLLDFADQNKIVLLCTTDEMSALLEPTLGAGNGSAGGQSTRNIITAGGITLYFDQVRRRPPLRQTQRDDGTRAGGLRASGFQGAGVTSGGDPARRIASAYFQATGVNATVDLGALHIDVQAMVDRGISNLFSEYPDVASVIQVIDAADLTASGFIAQAVQYPPVGKITADSGFWGTRPKDLAAQAATDAATGFHPKGSADPASYFTHEFGHHVHWVYSSRVGMGRIAARVLAETGHPLNFSNTGFLNHVGAHLSTYAKQDEQEYMAEAFLEWRLRPNPRVHARIVGEEADKVLLRPRAFPANEPTSLQASARQIAANTYG